jgi:hypothetical protein
MNTQTPKGNRVILDMTEMEATALFSLVNAANADGDHSRWLKDAGSSPAELAAVSRVTEKLQEARHNPVTHDALKAENEALREALHPFAKKWLPEDDMSPEDCIGVAEFDEFMIKRDNIRAARAALALSKDRSGS